MDDRFQVQFFCGDQRESFFQAEAHLVTECRNGTGTRAVFFLSAMGKNVLKQIEILFHGKEFKSA